MQCLVKHNGLQCHVTYHFTIHLNTSIIQVSIAHNKEYVHHYGHVNLT